MKWALFSKDYRLKALESFAFRGINATFSAKRELEKHVEVEVLKAFTETLGEPPMPGDILMSENGKYWDVKKREKEVTGTVDNMCLVKVKPSSSPKKEEEMVQLKICEFLGDTEKDKCDLYKKHLPKKLLLEPAERFILLNTSSRFAMGYKWASESIWERFDKEVAEPAVISVNERLNLYFDWSSTGFLNRIATVFAGEKVYGTAILYAPELSLREIKTLFVSSGSRDEEKR